MPPIVERACRQAARQARIPVTCPRLVPRSRYVTRTGLWGADVYSPRLWLLTFNNGDNGAGYVHWIVGAGVRGDLDFYVLGDEQNVVRGLPKRWALKRIGGRTVVEYRFPDYPAGGPNGSHALALVSCGNRDVFASLHGWERLAAAERMALDLAARAGCPTEAEPPQRLRTMPAPAGVAYACDRIRRQAGRQHASWRIVCPPLVPWSRSPHVAYAGGVTSTRNLRPGYLLDSANPPDGTSDPYAGHWTFSSGDPVAVHSWIGRPDVSSTRSVATIGGQRVALYRVAPGTTELSGHVAIEWTFRGQAYQVSVHRWAGDRQGLVQARAMAAAVIGYLRHRTPSLERPQRPR